MSAPKFRSRLFFILLYPDDPIHVSALSLIRSDYHYVGILHDKDVTEDGSLKKPHYHIVIKFPQAHWNTALASELGITSNYIQQCRSFDSVAHYLVHDGLPDKYQYSIDELEGDLAPAVAKLLVKDDENVRVTSLIHLIQGMGFISYESLVLLACEKGLYSDLRRMGYILSRIVDAHNETFARSPRPCDMSDKDSFDDFVRFTGDKNILPLE